MTDSPLAARVDQTPVSPGRLLEVIDHVRSDRARPISGRRTSTRPAGRVGVVGDGSGARERSARRAWAGRRHQRDRRAGPRGCGPRAGAATGPPGRRGRGPRLPGRAAWLHPAGPAGPLRAHGALRPGPVRPHLRRPRTRRAAPAHRGMGVRHGAGPGRGVDRRRGHRRDHLPAGGTDPRRASRAGPSRRAGGHLPDRSGRPRDLVPPCGRPPPHRYPGHRVRRRPLRRAGARRRPALGAGRRDPRPALGARGAGPAPGRCRRPDQRRVARHGRGPADRRGPLFAPRPAGRRALRAQRPAAPPSRSADPGGRTRLARRRSRAHGCLRRPGPQRRRPLAHRGPRGRAPGDHLSPDPGSRTGQRRGPRPRRASRPGPGTRSASRPRSHDVVATRREAPGDELWPVGSDPAAIVHGILVGELSPSLRGRIGASGWHR